MGLKEQQNLLAKLYTDPVFAASFFDDPQIGTSQTFSISEAEEIAATTSEEIRIFVDSLILKRLREVEKLLPITKRFLGDDFQTRFREHAQKFNPVSVKKHFEDALRFRAFLELEPSIGPLAKDVVKLETLKLRHFAEGRRFTAGLFRHDVRPIFDSHVSKDRQMVENRRSVAVWWRLNKRSRFLFI